MASGKESITVAASVEAPVEKVWECYTRPEHITRWCHASDDWHAPHAENDLREGGRFKTTMAARDGSFSFDFSGVYDHVNPHHEIRYTLDDGRKVTVLFNGSGTTTDIMQTFEAEETNSIEMQRSGWQAILENFKKLTEHSVV